MTCFVGFYFLSVQDSLSLSSFHALGFLRILYYVQIRISENNLRIERSLLLAALSLRGHTTVHSHWLSVYSKVRQCTTNVVSERRTLAL